jgi:NitT/TauT family transport system permease protein
MKRALGLIGPPLLVLVIVLGLWSLAVRLLEIPAFVLPGPGRVLDTALVESERLLTGFRNTFIAATVGLAAATVVGVLGAVVLSTSRMLERALYPWAVVLQTVPVVAIAPLFVLWVGPGLVSVVLVAFIIALFPILANTLMGLVSTDPALIDLLKMQGAGRMAIFRKIRLPNSLPYFFTGMRISAGLAVIGTIVGEMVVGRGGSEAGLGYYVVFSATQLKTDFVFATIIVSTALGIAFFLAMVGLASLVMGRWHESELRLDR